MATEHEFDYVYYGVKGTPGAHLHAVGMCDHTKGLRPATVEQLNLPYCGQCVNRIRELGGEVGQGAVMRYWWVSQNKTFEQEVDGGYLWSPKTRSDGGFNQYYENMIRVQPGDVLLSYKGARVAALGRIVSTGHESPKPDEFLGVDNPWSDVGWRVAVQYEVLPNENRVRPKDFIEELRPYLPSKYSPLNHAGDGPQNMYLTEISEDFFGVVTFQIANSGYDTSSWSDRPELDVLREEAEASLTDEIHENVVEESTRDALIAARRGQGKYRDGVLDREGRCRFTGVDDVTLLRAGHLMPWRDCQTHQQRLDPNNGLSLTPTYDHLVDRGLLTWDDDGNVRLSSRLSEQSRDQLGVSDFMNTGPWREAQLPYVRYHRSYIFRP